MMISVNADRATDAFTAEVLGEVAVLTPVRAGSVVATERTVGITVGRGLRIIIDARTPQVAVPVYGFNSRQEVFSQDTDPAVIWPAINFKPDPIDSEVSDMQFWEP